MNVDELLKANDAGASQVMDCLNTDNAKANLGKKRRAVGNKPASLSTANMKKPMPVSAAAAATEDNKENTAKVAGAAKQEDNESSSEPDFECLACGS